ncbi:helix-turn-helix domain-containing protein [Alicyclobacillus cycloheptanicus]|uniref:AraC-like DNA-binding protein n=1 Tax=Alicyclobacillus cycloheptanicus TaxID=1457 RepID=A0ABT9XF43_9BACL|nr:AraC family transcriptional regulator [Alicyclobacillus cycloheptanicus]MDQ0188920.1 AraC-like DNA-binding protein [Alicyclobacillus cycloheptanicus]WDM01731.1 helix-turn-helix domain-containing protein [Alicyclobacillus cycloheptanicus]
MNNPFINILWLAKSEYPSGSCLAPHAHADYYQIYYVVSGEGDFFVGKACVKMERGMYLFARPNDIHGIRTARDVDGEPLRMLEVKYVVFDSDFKEALNQLPMVCQGSDEIERMLWVVFTEAIETRPWYLEVATHTLITVLYHMIRHQRIERSTISGKSKIVDQIKENVNRNYQNDISLDQLSELVGHSKNYICKTFKEQTGMTINLYLNKVRIDRAAELLVNTHAEISEISSSVGYNNVYHFMKTFKKIVGTSPGNFRKSELCGSALVSSRVRAITMIPVQQTSHDIQRTDVKHESSAAGFV